MTRPLEVFSLLIPLGLLLPVSIHAKDPRKDPDEIGNRNVGKGVNFYSLEREIALGKEMARDIEWQSKFINEPIITEYINRLVQNLVLNSDAKVPFTIKVLDSDDVNALALPGGYLFVNSGLILKAGNEAELAGVLAHEIAHVAARHGTREATKVQIVNLASIPLIFMGGGVGYLVREGLNLAVPLGFLRFSQASEREADFLGLQYLYKAGYDPISFVDFFERLQSLEKTKPGSLSRLFSSHPMTSTRIRTAQREIQQILSPRSQYVVDTSEFESVKARLTAMQAWKMDTQVYSLKLRNR